MAEVSVFYEKKYICPVCQMNFSSLAVRSSKVYIGERESDFHVIYKGVSPTHYSIIVCPVCTYAASNNLFQNPLPDAMVKSLSMALSQMPLQEPVDFGQERDLETVLLSFKLAILSAQLKKVGAGELAGLLLAAAWIAREAGHKQMEDTYLDEALKHYLSAFQKSSQHVGNLSDVQAAYLIGELNLRQGNYAEAINWFNIVIFHHNIKSNPVIEKLARDQWSLAREMAKNSPAQAPSNDQKSEPIKEKQEEVKTEALPKAAAPSLTARRTKTMQMTVNIYPDQIEWLTQIVNRGYESSKHLISKEQIVRALIDTFVDKTKGKLPSDFSNEQELKSKLLALLDS